MPTWTIVLGTLLIFWTVFWIYIYNNRIWLISFPFSSSNAHKVLFTLLIPVSWFVSTLFMGIILFFASDLSAIDISALLIFPFIMLVVIIMGNIIPNRNRLKEQKELQRLTFEVRSKCLNWTKQFYFLSDKNVDLQVFVSKGNPVGKIIIHGVSHEEASILKQNKNKLPETVSILILN
ncbi:hypothetical protein J7E79_03715 [Bacillus sp. ISL-40]|uniref:hypothetical protein n=1 Tax=Bacillus sp. ISL-40 TaxID=2819126 RepID=UPI001BE737FE|nr:hypothetical protein [Bacillus sp. ISL-40]MBT2696534.1 hypothetical protein [Bacillus sp. ISL-40]